MSTDAPTPQPPETNVIDTLQSLIVAFVLAMTFRGFVTEGFVIPTGSMAPTLLGQHALIHSQMTGYSFAVGLDQQSTNRPVNANMIADPMLGPNYPGSGVPKVKRPRGMGDRILVLKALYPFSEPNRFDVVVFKNPTDPVGEAANYIKRLIGLPNEQVWLADGDVFARPLDGEQFKVQRKPEYVQRAVWQTVYNSDFAPMQPHRLNRRYEGPPWVGDPVVWDTDERTYSSNRADATLLTWDNSRRAVNDWTPYNMLAGMPTLWPVSDIRVSAGVVAQQPGLKSTFEIQARSHLYQFIIDQSEPGGAKVILRMRPLIESTDSTMVEKTATVKLPSPGKVFNVEFWHADQCMQMYIDGEPAVEPLAYDWTPMQRLRYSTGELESDDVDALVGRLPQPPQIRWRFEGAPVTLHRVRLDRDLHYRHETLTPGNQQRNGPQIYGHAFGTHPTSPENYPGILGPDQFMMCGDNSQMSLDSRLWGSPHPLVASQIDDHPFTVNRKLLLGKAWVVYFPAPYPLKEDGVAVIPDFGRLRFIR